MNVEYLKKEQLKDFIRYCIKHKGEIDESFLYDEDLKDFEPNDENPTYVVVNPEKEILAAASLIMDAYHRSGRKARFRIFHSELEDLSYYEMLMQALLKHTGELDEVFLFVPVINVKLMGFMEKLRFSIERYAFLLVKEGIDASEISLPEHYEIRPFVPGKDEEAWCEVRNAAFAHLKGSETPLLPEMVTNMITDKDYIEGGLMFLYHKEKPVGLVRCADDEFENSSIMNIGPVAVIPEYQGKGLGRSLLRAAQRFAKEHSYNKTVLCVNAENERAKALYLQEGFKQVEAVACYKYKLK